MQLPPPAPLTKTGREKVWLVIKLSRTLPIFDVHTVYLAPRVSYVINSSGRYVRLENTTPAVASPEPTLRRRVASVRHTPAMRYGSNNRFIFRCRGVIAIITHVQCVDITLAFSFSFSLRRIAGRQRFVGLRLRLLLYYAIIRTE